MLHTWRTRQPAKAGKSIPWKTFDEQQLRDALIWARDGGIALLLMRENAARENSVVGRIIGPDTRMLRRAAARLRLETSKMIQHRIPALHNYPVTGEALRRALSLCTAVSTS
jgi:hypothetical protein